MEEWGMGDGEWGTEGMVGRGGGAEEMGDGGGRGRSARFYKPQLGSLYNIYF
jgi:hypothetical protein